MASEWVSEQILFQRVLIRGENSLKSRWCFDLILVTTTSDDRSPDLQMRSFVKFLWSTFCSEIGGKSPPLNWSFWKSPPPELQQVQVAIKSGIAKASHNRWWWMTTVDWPPPPKPMDYKIQYSFFYEFKQEVIQRVDKFVYQRQDKWRRRGSPPQLLWPWPDNLPIILLNHLLSCWLVDFQRDLIIKNAPRSLRR